MGQRGLATQRSGPRLIAGKKGQTGEESSPCLHLDFNPQRPWIMVACLPQHAYSPEFDSQHGINLVLLVIPAYIPGISDIQGHPQLHRPV